jgi:hypothetical protein
MILKNLYIPSIAGTSVVVLMILLSSCDSFFDVERDRSLVPKEIVFSNDVTATSAMVGVYSDMLETSSFASGSNVSITSLASLSSDDLVSYSPDPDIQSIAQNEVRSDNRYTLTLWKSLYKTIYGANAVIQGVTESTSVSDSVKKQLEGEARFLRAFCNFYLVNLFGDVPLVKTVDYEMNSVIGKSSVADIYNDIIQDLNASTDMLSEEYVTGERVRANRSAAEALLARVYLFTENWQLAESFSSTVIDDGQYAIVDIDEVFNANNPEAIFQLQTVDVNLNTLEGYYFILSSSPIGSYMGTSTIRSSFVKRFDVNDKRASHWVATYAEGDSAWYYPFKYKVQFGGDPIVEYSTVLRLAEQYLIRAEARAMQGNLPGAIEDVDVVRNRAGIDLVVDTQPEISQQNLLSVINDERRFEFFSEWGHRWFDLKRTGGIERLDLVKSTWDPSDIDFPLPAEEVIKNPALSR